MHFFQALDLSLVHYFYSIRSGPFVMASIAISEFATWYAIAGISLIFSLYLYLFHDKYTHAYPLGLLVSTGGTGIVIAALKEFFMRARPDIFYQAYPESWYAFPSGHAAGAIALYGYLWYLVEYEIKAPEIVTIIARIGAPFFIVLIGISRLYLDVHFFTDVVAGYIVGALFLAVGIAIARRGSVTLRGTRKH